eukprot:GFUD01045614.1.p1 GENE.GFUD01045614.1~~GFUD01045614.1.p1  ORF type:complete len:717 (-),score=114.69 GFUD01045614.1:192-2342(-)
MDDRTSFAEEEEESDSDSEQLSPLKLRKQLEELEPDEEEEMVLPSPPDGGWGWVVCAASFLCNMILDGIAYSFGVLLTPLCRYFDSDAGTVSWVGSLLCGVYLMSGPIVGGLVNKYGCRPVCMAGSLISCVAFSLSIFATNVPMLMLTYGVLGGFGLGLIYLPAVVAVGYYFEKKRALATGISVCGSGVGTFIFAPFATYLLDKYGWRGANIIFAALCLQCAVFGALMRPLSMTVLVEEEDEEEDKCVLKLPDGTIHTQSVNKTGSNGQLSALSEVPSPSHGRLPLPTITEQGVTANDTKKEENGSLQDVFPSKLSLRKKPRMRTTSENEYGNGELHGSKGKLGLKSPTKEGRIPRNQSAPHFALANNRNMSTTFTPLSRVGSSLGYSIGSGSQLQVGDSNTNLKGATVIVRPLSRKDIFYSRSIYNVNNDEMDQNEKISGLRSNRQSYVSMHSGLRSNKQSFVSIHRGSLVNSHLALPIISEKRRASVLSEEKEMMVLESGGGMLAVLKEMMNFKLLADPLFFMIGISNVFGMIGFYTPFVYLPSMAAQYDDISVEDAAFLVSIIGVSNTLGRVLSGWVSDFEWVNSLVVTNIAIILSAACVFVLPFCSTYSAFVAVALLFGFFVAAYISLTSIVLVDLLGLDNLTSAFGLLTLFRGSSSMIGPPINGWIFEETKSYDFSFFVSGAFLLVAGLISCLVDFLKRRRDSSNKTMVDE